MDENNNWYKVTNVSDFELRWTKAEKSKL